MFGNKKKHHQKNNETEHGAKKKWQLELEEEQDAEIPENLEIPKDISEDEVQDVNIEQDGPVNEAIDINKEVDENKDDHKEKEFEWMSSEDEENREPEYAEHNKEVQEIQANKDSQVEGQPVEMKNQEDTRTIFISNIPLNAADEEVLEKFREFGSILNVEIPRNEGSKLNKGRAFIEFSSEEEAKQAVEATIHLKSNQLQVTLGLSTATTMLATAQKDTPFVYDERTHRYRKVGEMDLIKDQRQKAQQNNNEDESESGSGSGSESGSESGSDSGSSDDSESEKSEKQLRKKSPSQSEDEDNRRKGPRGRGNKNNERSRSRSKSKSPARIKVGRKK